VRDLDSRAFDVAVRRHGASTGASTPERSFDKAASGGPGGPAGSADEMILVTRLFGGLGSELFQYAAALAAGRHYGVSSRFIAADSSPLDRVLGSAVPRASTSQMRSVGRVPVAWPPWRRRLSRRWITATRVVRPYATVRQRNFEQAFSEVTWPESDRVLLDGHFLNRSVYEDSLALVIGAVVEGAHGGPPLVRGDRHIAVHFRRRDTVPLGRTLPLSYYLEALHHADPQKTTPLWMVGDDVIFAHLAATCLAEEGWTIDDRQQFHDDQILNDFWTVAIAQHVIGANSRFSWWASVVGDHLREGTHRVVIAPEDWVVGRPNRLLRPGWRAV
jgi:hypothetical protein